MSSFPTAESVEAWYLAAHDGLCNLERLFHSNQWRNISGRVRNDIYGMTPTEWAEYRDKKLGDHELAACLALLAVVEGGIRRDLVRRVAEKRPHHLELKRLAGPKHFSITAILQSWRKIISNRFARKHLNELVVIYTDSRNSLAHGHAAYGSYTFPLIFNRLLVIEAKWKGAVRDFKGF